VAQSLGGFDEALDMGAVLPGGGDHDMLWRMLVSGREVVYEPRVRAKHLHRATVEGAIGQIIGHQKALIALLTKILRTCPLRDRVPVFVFLAWRLGKPGVRLLACAVGNDPLPMKAILGMWKACWQGLSAYRMGAELAEQRRRETVR
ncbi:hypothetical protein K8I85_15050, partial [bacterium]|nr:hypothetical protein [bacterium]